MRILVIEDNERLARLVVDGLQRRGFSCDTALSLSGADDAMTSATYDAIILDLGLPDGDGIDWLMAARRYREIPPAIVQTARGALEDRVQGLDAGADDYVVKPVDVEELAARLRALLRRPGIRAQTIVQVGTLRFDAARRIAHVGDHEMELSRREADLLELLMRRAGTVVRREVIENALYNFNEPVTPNAVEAAISRLRRKLEDAQVRGALQTIRGWLYPQGSDCMMRRNSVSRRLIRGLGQVGLVGTLLLFAAVIFFYRLTFSHLDAGAALRRAILESLEHVALPVIVLMVPVTVVGLRVIRQAFVPLEEAAIRIEAVKGHERGFRIDTSQMPEEALPFTGAVNDLLERLDEAARRQEAFAADVAHELRTPLALLSLELDRLDQVDAPRLKGDVAAMRRLIDQLMLLAQIDAAASAQIAPEQVRLVEIAREVVSLLAPAILSAGKMIALDIEDETVIVRGRKEAIATALRNLIENAVRVTPAGGMIQVFVGPGATTGVRDEGPGLDQERLRDLVRRHRRADHASKDGAGLGLAIVDQIMAAHDGLLVSDPDRRELMLRFPDV
jgi:DNA-binding response OmpR family regulator/signal transduction histidine kinase